MEATLKGMLDSQQAQLSETCTANQSQIEQKSKSIADMRDLILGVSSPLGRMITDNREGVTYLQVSTLLHFLLD